MLFRSQGADSRKAGAWPDIGVGIERIDQEDGYDAANRSETARNSRHLDSRLNDFPTSCGGRTSAWRKAWRCFVKRGSSAVDIHSMLENDDKFCDEFTKMQAPARAQSGLPAPIWHYTSPTTQPVNNGSETDR